jgi:LDH2 family malate/lactate/ureidoglycolate dehydrogenase
MDNWITSFKNARTIEGQANVIIPGDPERETEILRMKEGIPLLDQVVKELEDLGEKFSVKIG